MQSKPKGETPSRSRSGRTDGRRKAAKSAGGPKGRGTETQHSQERLRPGQLNGLVLVYMKKHKGKLPVSPVTVAQGIERSAGAVANCLERLASAKEVRLVDRKPRRYDLAGTK